MGYLIYGCALGIPIEYPYRRNRLTHGNLEVATHDAGVKGLVLLEVPEKVCDSSEDSASDLGNVLHDAEPLKEDRS